MATKLYRYWDAINPARWAESAEEYRKLAGSPRQARIFRVAHVGIEAPSGFKKTGRELAHEPVVKVRNATRSIIKALTP